MLGQYYKEKLFLTDKTNFKDTDGCSLSLFISHNSLVYSISNNNFNNVIELCHVELLNTPGGGTFTEKIEILLNNYQIPQKKFDKILISISNKEFALIPESYSKQSDISEFLRFSNGLTDVKNPIVHSIKNVKFCYVFEQDLIYFLEKTFSQAIIKHSGAVNIDLFFGNHSLINCNLFISLNDGLLEIIAKEKNDLLFYNIFSYENNEDILYYLLFMMEQFNLNPLQVKLLVCGQIQTNDPLILSLKKYIKHVNFGIHDSKIKLEGQLSKLPLHQYFTVLNQHLCA